MKDKEQRVRIATSLYKCFELKKQDDECTTFQIIQLKASNQI